MDYRRELTYIEALQNIIEKKAENKQKKNKGRKSKGNKRQGSIWQLPNQRKIILHFLMLDHLHTIKQDRPIPSIIFHHLTMLIVRHSQTYHSQSQPRPGYQRASKPDRVFTPFTEPPVTMLLELLALNLVSKVPPWPLNHPLPQNYDQNTHCAYYIDAPRYSLKHCWPLKHNFRI